MKRAEERRHKMKFLKNLNKKQKTVISSVIGGVLMIAVVAVCVLYKHGVFSRKAPTASEETVQTVTESITESVTESSSESTTESTTEKETKPPAAPVTKAYKPKPAAPAPPKASASSKSVKLNVPLVKKILNIRRAVRVLRLQCSFSITDIMLLLTR